MAPTARDFAAEILTRLGIPTSYLSHLRELRSRLLRIFVTVGFFYVLFFMFELKEVARVAGLPILAPLFAPFHPAASQVLTKMVADLIPPDVQLFQVSPPELVILYMQIALALAIACSMPMILYQFGRFVMPALYARERREMVRLIGPGLILFGLGCLFAYRIVVPPIMDFLFQYSREFAAGSPGTILVSVSIGQALEFCIILVLAFGVIFEMPLVMGVLTRLGLVQAKTWRHYWRHAFVVFMIVGGFITPDTSGVTQVLVALPMAALYLTGCVFAFAAEKRSARAPVSAAV